MLEIERIQRKTKRLQGRIQGIELQLKEAIIETLHKEVCNALREDYGKAVLEFKDSVLKIIELATSTELSEPALSDEEIEAKEMEIEEYEHQNRKFMIEIAGIAKANDKSNIQEDESASLETLSVAEEASLSNQDTGQSVAVTSTLKTVDDNEVEEAPLNVNELTVAIGHLTKIVCEQQAINKQLLEASKKGDRGSEGIKLGHVSPDSWDGDLKTYYVWKENFLDVLAAGKATNSALRKTLLLKSVPTNYHNEIKTSGNIEEAFSKFETVITHEKVYSEIKRDFTRIRKIADNDGKQMSNMALMIERHRDRLIAVGQGNEVSGLALINDCIDNKLPSRISTDYVNFEEAKGRRPCVNTLIEYLRRVSTHYQPKQDEKKPGHYARTGSVQNSANQEGGGDTDCACTKPCYDVTKCPRFKAMSIDERRSFVREKSRCFLCFGKHHRAKKCKQSIKCSTCNGRHNTMVHSPSLVKGTEKGDPNVSMCPLSDHCRVVACQPSKTCLLLCLLPLVATN